MTAIRKFPNGTTEDTDQKVEFYCDSNPFDGSFTTYANGRVAATRYYGKTPTAEGGNTYIDMYSYTRYGATVAKRLRLTEHVKNNVNVLVPTTADLNGAWQYDGEGRLSGVTYPVTGRQINYGYDSRGMLITATDPSSRAIVTSAGYNEAGQMTSLATGGGSESRGYNVMGQLTSISGLGVNVTYAFSPTANNGKLTSMTDVASGETITYQYDVLQRLSSASGSGWTQTFTYDGFGNLTTKAGTGSAPSGGWSADPATNRVTTFTFDANGNQTYSNGFSLTFDVMNRMNSAASISQTSNYEYDSANKRIFEARWSGGVKQGEWMYFFGVTGQRLGKYYVNVTGGVSPAVTFSITDASVWFAGRLVQKGDPSIGVSFVGQDRLGSVGKYLPYGEDKPGATNPGGDQEKFATYTRDGVTGLDYADQRWHVSGAGRFLSGIPVKGVRMQVNREAGIGTLTLLATP